MYKLERVPISYSQNTIWRQYTHFIDVYSHGYDRINKFAGPCLIEPVLFFLRGIRSQEASRYYGTSGGQAVRAHISIKCLSSPHICGPWSPKEVDLLCLGQWNIMHIALVCLGETLSLSTPYVVKLTVWVMH